MIKKFTYVFSLTFICQLLSLFSISFIVKKHATEDFIEFVALLDSSTVLITTILSFGIIQITSREIVTSMEWKKVIENTQNIRINFSYVLSFIGLLLYVITKKYYFLSFLFSPLIALNVNYVFYAKGMAPLAVKNSSIRLIILSLSLICLGIFEFFSKDIYLFFFILGLTYVAFISNSLLETTINFKIDPYFFKGYSKSIGVGITDLAIIFLEFGILFFASFFYNTTIVSGAYILIKIITLVKGFQRMIFQVFYDQLIYKEKVYFLDQIILFVGYSFFMLSFFFSKEILNLIYSKNSTIFCNNFIFFSLALLIGSIILTAMARTLIIKKDKTYIRSYFLSLLLSSLTMVLLSYSKINYYGISIALLVGELVLFLSFFCGIWEDIFLKKKIIVFVKYIILFLFYYLISKLFQQQILFFIIIIIQLTIAVIFLFQNKKILSK